MPVPPELTDLWPETVRGLYGYDIDEICCEQTHTVLYRGERKIDGLKVLIKLFRNSTIPDWGMHWLQRDYQIAQGIKANCAAKPVAFEQTDRGPALVYADDGARPLKTLIAKKTLDIESALTLAASIAEAVAALHKERVIHCNLNPTTVWFNDESGVALISDFGCGRCLSEEGIPRAPFGDELIDVRYMSPEQTGRFQNIVDHRTDIYSLGIIFFGLLTGKVPFDGADPLQIVDGHVARRPAFPAALPAGLAKVVLKALAKGPDARYHSVSGLVADLHECRTLWQSTGAIVDDFEPGHHDAQGMLQISRQLYGRERETAVLLEKVKATQLGPPSMLLVKGAPGVGKSTLLNQLEDFVRSRNGRFVSGKFDQYKRNVPYLALTQAFQQLIGQLLGGTTVELERWRSRILTAVGDNARVVIDGLPDLELITGPQPQVRALPPVQARNRLNRIFARLIQAIASRDELLCVVLDDLQWVDMASLALLSHVLTSRDTKNVMIVGAYRDNEVGPGHPLVKSIAALKQSNVDVHILGLAELKEPDLLHLVRDTFMVSTSQASDLTQVLYWKSGGNPLYLTQFLPYLCDAGLIAFDHRIGKWGWDLARIKREGVTQDVLDLLHKRLGTLQQDTREVLAIAACLGSSFEIGKLAIAAERPLSEVLQCMTICEREALIVGIEDWPTSSGHSASSNQQPANRFRFLHDRIQEAAFNCIPDDAKKGFRLQIGLRLMAALSPEDELVPQLDVLNNLNATWDLIVEQDERQRVARLNMVAGRKARHALAYQDALGYISVGLSLLDDNAWHASYELAFGLHSEALECEYLTGNFERADQLFSTLIANARSKLEKARIYRTKIVLANSDERYEEAITVGIAALRMFGIRYVRNPSKLDQLSQLLLVRLRLRGRKPQDLLQTKALEDPEKLAALRTLIDIIPTAYLFDKDLFVFTTLKAVNYSLRYGNAPVSAVSFVAYGLILGGGLDDIKRGYEFGRMAVELAERSKDASIICKVVWIFAAMILSWRDPIDESFPLFERARRLALDVGEHQYAAYTIISIIFALITSGKPLEDVLRECDAHWPFILQSKDQASIEFVAMCRNHVLALQGKTAELRSLSDNASDDAAYEHRFQQTGNLTFVFYQNLLRLKLACRFGRFDEALVLASKGEAVVDAATGFPQVGDHYLYRGLAAAVALSNQQDGSKRDLRRTLQHSLARLNLFAANSPHNFAHYKTLVEAEAAHASGDLTKALKHYDRAAELAEAEGYTHIVGLANERAAQCCLAKGHSRLAGWYLASARAIYEKWGAVAKVAALDSEYAYLLPAAVSAPNEATRSSESYSIRHHGEGFDVAAALQASRIIASGENTDRVLTHLMQVIRIQAGAETAQLLIFEGGELRLEASATVESGGVLLFPSASNEGSFSPAIVNYVTHTGDELLLSEVGMDARFNQCNYIVGRRPKSVLCSAIRHQGEVLGVIYLEHTGIAGAFNGQKLEWLRLLATEVGLAVWSARLSRYREYVHKFAPSSVAKEIDNNPVSPNLEAKDTDVSILFYSAIWRATRA